MTNDPFLKGPPCGELPSAFQTCPAGTVSVAGSGEYDRKYVDYCYWHSTTLQERVLLMPNISFINHFDAQGLHRSFCRTDDSTADFLDIDKREQIVPLVAALDGAFSAAGMDAVPQKFWSSARWNNVYLSYTFTWFGLGNTGAGTLLLLLWLLW